MNCPKCGVEITDKSGQCPSCWTKTSSAKERPARPKYFKPIVAAMIALAILGIAALVVASVLKSRQADITYAPSLPQGPNTVLGTNQNLQPQDNVLGAPVPDNSGGNVLQAPPASPLPTQQTIAGKPKPPDSVVAYLAHVKETERYRQAFYATSKEDMEKIISQVGVQGITPDMVERMTDPDNNDKESPGLKVVTDLLKKRQQEIANIYYFFKKTPPTIPPECADFAKAYEAVLYAQVAAHGIAANEDKQTATKNIKSLGNINDLVKTANDIKKSTILDVYDIENPFDVGEEQGSGGSILGL